MKHTLTTILSLLALALLAASCGKTPQNGDLDGKWRLAERIAKKAYTQDTDPGTVYWSFSLDLLSINTGAIHNGKTTETVCRFAHEGNRLSITQAYVHYRDRDSLLTDPNTEALAAVGIHGNQASFRVAALSSSTLILVSDRDSLVFRKPH